jgi:hypothetical protein
MRSAHLADQKNHYLGHDIGNWGISRYFAPRGLAALARPLALVPRKPPLAAPPLPDGAIPPRPPIRDGAGVENFGVAFDDVGGLSTKDVSVVLLQLVVE